MTKTINLLLNINWLSHNYCLWLALGWGLPCPSGRITNHWPHTVMTQQGLQSRNGAIFHPYWRKGKLISTTKKKIHRSWSIYQDWWVCWYQNLQEKTKKYTGGQTKRHFQKMPPHKVFQQLNWHFTCFLTENFDRQLCIGIHNNRHIPFHRCIHVFKLHLM